MRLRVAIIASVLIGALASPAHATTRSYARHLVLNRWHSRSQFHALDSVVRPESGWDPCAHYPSTHGCGYRGSAACGIPQRDPCPAAWRGRLYATRFAQVRWLVSYVRERYGDPLHALWFRESHGWY